MTDFPDQSSDFYIDLAPGVRVPASAVRMQFARSSGPGGQNVNKLNTRAELWLALGAVSGLSPQAMSRLRRIAGKRLTTQNEIHISAQTDRSQERNREAAMDRLKDMVATALIEPKPRRPTKPSKGSKRRRLESKKRRSQIKTHRSGRDSEW